MIFLSRYASESKRKSRQFHSTAVVAVKNEPTRKRSFKRVIAAETSKPTDPIPRLVCHTIEASSDESEDSECEVHFIG